MDAVGICRGRDVPTNPGFDFQVFLQGWAHQLVPEVLVPFAILGDDLEIHTALGFELDDVGIALDLRRPVAHELGERIVFGQATWAWQVGLRLLVVDHLGGNFARRVQVEREAKVGLTILGRGLMWRLGLGEFGPGVQEPASGVGLRIESQNALGVAHVGIVLDVGVDGRFVIVQHPAGGGIGLIEDGREREVQRALMRVEREFGFFDLSNGRVGAFVHRRVVVHILIACGGVFGVATAELWHFVDEPPVHGLAGFVECRDLHDREEKPSGAA